LFARSLAVSCVFPFQEYRAGGGRQTFGRALLVRRILAAGGCDFFGQKTIFYFLRQA
jgi:hypothetical protein